MKKLTLSVLLALSTISTSTLANVYIQGDIGSSKITPDDFNGGTATDFRISIGYDFGNYRLAADYTKFGTVSESDQVYGVNVDYSAKIQSIGFSAIYDFHNSTALTPYLGVRVGYTKADVSVAANRSYYQVSADSSTTSAGFGALAGIQYKFTDHIDLNLGAEYNRLASDISQFGGKLGLRFNF
ncbi:opacity family porin [Glaesserella parasuis]|uniref:opacity family porin n=1 Tax=Glaesserella parasuis TaxID=738 RepID=UPI00094F6BAC|nr:opacity family porin [Glaesserella parasuis]MDG6345242.1 opacity family porin [Glaesserella parasuis]MDG6770867.1 opacity family porin [Glaesserella parasuis]MDO9872751.1 opacity family porin [Glaesserella parasuis]MDO9912857.1 opacity family porin [Glaesserella parasuis]MDP0349805.1 opacity family porin [Glaesserella parasuis]